MRTIAEIEKERKRARITKRELCRAGGIHAETYRRWLLDRVSPTLRRLGQVENALDSLKTGAAE